MESERTAFIERKFFPVIFVIVLTIVFIAILATIYSNTTERVKTYNDRKEMIQILGLFSINTDEKHAEKLYKKHISTETMKLTEKEIIYYVARNEDSLLGYCFKVEGKGLWGKINALLAISPDKKSILGLLIVEQNETPGLGARIGEEAFLNQFKDKLLANDSFIIKYSLVPEDTDENALRNDQIRQITGATASSNAIVNMIYNEMKPILQGQGTDTPEKAEL